MDPKSQEFPFVLGLENVYRRHNRNLELKRNKAENFQPVMWSRLENYAALAPGNTFFVAPAPAPAPHDSFSAAPAPAPDKTCRPEQLQAVMMEGVEDKASGPIVTACFTEDNKAYSRNKNDDNNSTNEHQSSSVEAEDGACCEDDHSQSNDSDGTEEWQQNRMADNDNNGVGLNEAWEGGGEDMENSTVSDKEESMWEERSDPDQLFICFECGETFDDKESHRFHVRSHNLPFKCSVCGEGFNDRDSLIRHAEIHAMDKNITNMPVGFENFRGKYTDSQKEKRKYTRNNNSQNSKECPICHKTFSTVYVMKNHMDIHTGVKEHKCHICGKTFSAKRYLTKHIDTHSGEKPYQCSICQKAFRTAYYLRVHTRLHTGDLPFGCQVCGKTFNVITELKVHMRHHTGEKPYKCSICEMAFAAASYLRTHMRIHTGEKPHECRICSRRFGRSNGLKTHMATHLGLKEHKCPFCDKGFNRQDELRSHVFRKHKSERLDGEVEGEGEGRTFQEMGRNLLRVDNNANNEYFDGGDTDMTEQEADSLEGDAVEQEDDIKSVSTNDMKRKKPKREAIINGAGDIDTEVLTGGDYGVMYDSDDMDKKIPIEDEDTEDYSDFEDTKVSEPEGNSYCGSSDTSNRKLHEVKEDVHSDVDGLDLSMSEEGALDLVTHSEKANSKDFPKMRGFDSEMNSSKKDLPAEKLTTTCHICNASIDRVRDLITTSTGETLLECSVCKTISDQEPTHVLENESTEMNSRVVDAELETPPPPLPQGHRKRTRSNICPICKKEFAPTYLKVHMEIHSGLKPYKCGVCAKVFNARRYLTKHLETHKDVKKYRCDICNKTFGSKYYLKIHTSVHTGHKEFSCEICGKQFNIRPDLKTHMRVHTGEKPYACSLCDRAFISSAYLRSHMKIHTGEKNHECPICEKKFSRSNDLKIHVTTHTGDKPYKCLKCEKGFNRSGEIDAHMNSAHGMDVYEFFHNGAIESSTDLVLDPADTAKTFDPDSLDCTMCGRAFSKKAHLKSHMRTHDDRLYSCFVCFKAFPDSGKLKRHLKVHEKELAASGDGVSGSGDSLQEPVVRSSSIEMEYDKFDFRLHLPPPSSSQMSSPVFPGN